MYWLQLVVIVALLAAVGWLAIGGGGHMSEPVADRPDLALPSDGLLARADVDRVRFSVGARGYRMDEVDDVLDRLAQEIELRERRIAELEGRAPEQGAGTESSAWSQSEAQAQPEVAAESEAVAQPGVAAVSERASGVELGRESASAAQSAAEPEGAAEAEPGAHGVGEAGRVDENAAGIARDRASAQDGD